MRNREVFRSCKLIKINLRICLKRRKEALRNQSQSSRYLQQDPNQTPMDLKPYKLNETNKCIGSMEKPNNLHYIKTATCFDRQRTTVNRKEKCTYMQHCINKGKIIRITFRIVQYISIHMYNMSYIRLMLIRV